MLPSLAEGTIDSSEDTDRLARHVALRKISIFTKIIGYLLYTYFTGRQGEMGQGSNGRGGGGGAAPRLAC
jgi:hypothetical protein